MDATTVADFADVLEPANYVGVPEDWFVALGDVVQSTNAIVQGRYKDVNLAGAATIAAILNACPGSDLPFAFGGDGGVVLIPPRLRTQAHTALKGVQKIGRDALNLDLRCVLVPIAAIRAKGNDVRIAYQALGPARRLAMLSGGGIDAAEAIAKSQAGAPFLVNADAATQDADLTGLSCRWQPLRAQNGVMLTAIIRTRTNAEPLPRTYRELYRRITAAAARDVCPVAASNLNQAWPPRGGAIERRFGRGFFEVYGQSFWALVSEATNTTIGGYNGRAYARSVPSHSDYRKFADSLRMVVDCSQAESDAIEAILREAKSLGLIDFGLHRASAALMTCFVGHTNDGGHVHFIDGADGGYAMAAQELKSQIDSNV